MWIWLCPTTACKMGRLYSCRSRLPDVHVPNGNFHVYLPPEIQFPMATYNRKNNKTCFSFNSDRHCDEMAHPFLRNGNLERLGAHTHLRSDATARHLLRDHCRHGIIHPTQTFSSNSPALANRLFYPSTGRKRIREKSR